MTITDVLNSQELDEVINLTIQLSFSLKDLRKSNREADRPKWADRIGDYENNLKLLVESVDKLQKDYVGRVGQSGLMKVLFGVESNL